ncbi:hypothetical protein [Terrihabitans sp. B22-R8]|uniref:hypothetical protein n=1 Tax=Terrihabitans sp. B22-R8 TaxID=3425128 RepID=UPI00403C3684
MDTQELTRILTLLKSGMTLTVTDEWLDANIPGTPAERARRINTLACEFSCVHKHGMGFQTFERVDYPRLG